MGTTFTGGNTATRTATAPIVNRDAYMADNGLFVRPFRVNSNVGTTGAYNPATNIHTTNYLSGTTNQNYPVIGQQPVGSYVSTNPVGSYVSTNLRSGGTVPNKQYAETITQLPVLRQPVLYTRQNLNSLFGGNLQYPPSDAPIYHMKKSNDTYRGKFLNGFPQDQRGQAYFQDGGFYSGQFVRGDASGRGLYIYPNGSVYQGEFRNSEFNGRGVLIYIDRRLKYDGDFLNGRPHGGGTQTYGDGSSYQGGFLQGQKNGQGVYQWANGQRYQGGFVNGLMEGKGILSKNGMVLYNGNWSKGMKNGYGVFRTQNGTYEGNFDDDLLNGNGTFIWNDGKVYEGNFLKSMFNGRGRMYYPSNQVAEGQWVSNHNKSLTALKNDSSVAQKIRQIRSKHELASKPVPVVLKSGSLVSDQYNQSSVIKERNRDRDESMRYDDSYRSHNSRHANEVPYDNKSYGASNVYSSSPQSYVHQSSAQESYAKNSNVIYS